MTTREILKLATVGAAAYVLGAKAGRGRYEQVMSWMRRARVEGERKVHELRDAAAGDRVTLPDMTLPDIEITSPAYPNAAKS
jgi:hypothetical protein